MPPLENRRKEERRPATGRIVLVRASAMGRIDGELVDVSASGFRAAVGAGMLSAGEEVGFESGESNGVAVVMWSRIVGGRQECGFLIRQKAG